MLKTSIIVLTVVWATHVAGAPAKVCPENPGAPGPARRAQAKEWFAEGEAAQARGDGIGALKAFACSFRLVPHAFTAFNLARAAEKVGDLEQAVGGYRDYLTLAPEAQDRAAVEESIRTWEARIAKLNAAPPSASGSGARGGGLPDARASGGSSAPGLVASASSAPVAPRRQVLAASLTLGGGALAVAGGVILNLVARQKMRDCHTLWSAERFQEANAACDAAAPMAYGSYALFGVAGAAAVAGSLLWWDRRAPETVAFSPQPGGGVLIAGGSF